MGHNNKFRMDDPRVEWRIFLVTLAATLISVAAFWIAIPPIFLTNDDVSIRLGIEGLTVPGEPPTGFVLMAHSLFAWALVGVRRALPVHAWDLALGALIVWSTALALALAWTWGGVVRIARATALLAALAVLIPLVGGVQFTISSTLAGGAAMALAATEILASRPRPAFLIMAASLLFAGLLVRPMGATVGAVLTGLFLTPLAFKDALGRRSRLIRLGGLMAGVAGAAAALVYLDGALYTTDAPWAEYQRNMWIMARLFEWGGDLPAGAIDRMRERAGWSPNDWEALKTFWGVDPDVHSLARIEDAYASWADVVGWQTRLQWLMRRTVAHLTGATLLRLLVESAVPIAAGVVLAVTQARRAGLVAAAALLALFVASCLAIESGFKELPFRLLAPLQACFVLAIVIAIGTWRRQTRTAAYIPAAILLCVLVAYEAQLVARHAVADDEQSDAVERQVADLLQLQPSLLVLHADSFPFEHWWRPFRTPPVRLHSIQLGTTNHNPYLQAFLSTSYSQGLLRAICTDPSILVVGERDRLDTVATFVREHYGLHVTWTEAYAGSFRAWRCTPQR